MSEYTPTTDEVRFAWAQRVGKHDQESADEFDRWLAAERTYQAALGWDAAIGAMRSELTLTVNPFRVNEPTVCDPLLAGDPDMEDRQTPIV